MATKEHVISGILNKCNEELLSQVIELLTKGNSFKEIENKLSLSSYALSDYIVAGFAKSDIAPDVYVDKEDFGLLMKEIDTIETPYRKIVRDKMKEQYNKDYSYDSINVVLGVYFRTKRFYNKKNVVDGRIVEEPKNTPVSNEVAQTSFAQVCKVTDVEKIDLTTVPMFYTAINALYTEHWKKFAIELFSKLCPKQFFIMPATMGKTKHNIVELSYGKFNDENPCILEKMGGKCFHSIRVYEAICTLLEPDKAEIKDFKGITKDYKYGNEFEKWEEDMLKVAALAHDIYSGGTSDEFDYSRKRLDVNHPYYHRKELASISHILPDNEWNAFLKCIENHMWKWSPKECDIYFKDGLALPECEKDNFYHLYRMVKNLEIADYFASRRENNRGQEIIYSIETYYNLFGTYEIPDCALEKMNITPEEMKKAFGHSDLSEIINICKKIK